MATTTRAKRLMKRTGTAAAVGGAGLMALSMFAMPVSAGGNPNFAGMLSAASPTGFPVSPSSLDASSGSATVTFNVVVNNLTSSAQHVKLNFSADHILTYKGTNVANGQPGQAGITFNGPANTTQSEISGRQAFTLSLAASEKNHKLTLTRSISQCGYYQLDVWAPNTAANAPRDRETLASGFTRVLGCGGGGVQATPTAVVTVGGGGGVQAITSPSTGAGLEGPALGGLALVTVGLGLVVAAARRPGGERRVP